MINIDKVFEKKNLKTKMLLQVHDELVFEAPTEEVEVATYLIKPKWNLPWKHKFHFWWKLALGKNWLEAALI